MIYAYNYGGRVYYLDLGGGFCKEASRWKTMLSAKSIEQMLAILRKRPRYRLPSESTIRTMAKDNPAIAKDTLLEYVRGTGRKPDPALTPLTKRRDVYTNRGYRSNMPQPVTMQDLRRHWRPDDRQLSFDESLAVAKRRFQDLSAPKLKPVGEPVSPLSLTDDARKHLWHGFAADHPIKMLDDQGRFARRDELGRVTGDKLWYGAAPEIAAVHGTGLPGTIGYMVQQSTDVLRPFRLPGQHISKAITGHQPNDSSILPSLPKTPRNRQFEAVAVNEPAPVEKIYEVVPNTRPGEPVALHPGSRPRRKNPAKFGREYGEGDAQKFGLANAHMLQEMTFAELLENVRRNKAQYIKSLGNLTWQ